MQSGELEKNLHVCHEEVLRQLREQAQVRKMQQAVLAQQERVAQLIEEVHWRQEAVRAIQKRAGENLEAYREKLDAAWARLREATARLEQEHAALGRAEEDLKRASAVLHAWPAPSEGGQTSEKNENSGSEHTEES